MFDRFIDSHPLVQCLVIFLAVIIVVLVPSCLFMVFLEGFVWVVNLQREVAQWALFFVLMAIGIVSLAYLKSRG